MSLHTLVREILDDVPGEVTAMQSTSIYRIGRIHRARWNGRLVKIFTAYIQQPDGAFVHFGQFTAPPRTANRDLWKIAAEAATA